MTVVSGHRRSNDVIAVDGNQEKIGLDRHFGPNNELRRPPMVVVQKQLPPQRFHAFKVTTLIHDDVELHPGFRPRHLHLQKQKPADFSTGTISDNC